MSVVMTSVVIAMKVCMFEMPSGPAESRNSARRR